MVKQTIQIFGRIRPTKKAAAVYSVNNEEQAGASLGFLVPKDLADGFVNNKRDNYKFRFKKVFDQATKQEEVFENVAKPIADSVLAGYNGTIFAYGQTGSGKTFTITGGPERYSDRGLIPRSLSYLFECLNQDSSLVSTIHISYLEIYNELGYDLLDSRREATCLEDLPKVSIMEDADQNVHLRNLTLQQAANEEEALNLLFVGDTNRVIAETPINQASTRSHCIFTAHICRREPGSATLRRSKLHLVDLAGSDRVSKSGLDGHLLSEAKYINLSLHCLELVIIALSERNRSHIPYRNSMLTHVLRDSLGGNCMTTMIANMAVDNRNIYESISTCRFAQRVALIKNEAILNEELDPALLIARLKREVLSLREELVMATGEQRSDRLTVEEIQKLEEPVKAFLNDPDPDATLSLGPDMRKIQHCFSMLKKLILDKREGKTTCHGKESPVVREEAARDSHESAAEVAKLKERLGQRDNEICVLVKLLKKEKKRARDAIAQLARITGDQSLSSPRASIATARPNEGSEDPVSVDHGGRAMQYTRRGPQLSSAKQEAYEMFLRNHEDRVTVDNNMTLLNQRCVEAQKLGMQLKEARIRINELKKQIEKRRRQRAAQSVLEDHPTAQGEFDPVEESLRKQIQQENTDCKSCHGRYRALMTEVEHLKLLLERAKVRLQKDFQRWWDQEASSLQEPESGAAAGRQPASPPGTLLPSTPGTPGLGTPGSNRTVADCSADRGRDAQPPPQEPRPLETTTYSSILLTGDEQIDADILAFVRARENLLSGTRNTHK